MTLREALLNAIGESCAVAPPTATQQRNFSTDPTLNALLEAAMRRCDERPDSDKARQDMREEILGTPPHLRLDLLDYFLSDPGSLK